jgi:hypothetical protein
MAKIEFTTNYSDLSTDTGFRTDFQAYAMGTVAGALDTASSLFGGVFGQAADVVNGWLCEAMESST